MTTAQLAPCLVYSGTVRHVVFSQPNEALGARADAEGLKVQLQDMRVVHQDQVESLQAETALARRELEATSIKVGQGFYPMHVRKNDFLSAPLDYLVVAGLTSNTWISFYDTCV